MSTSSYTLQIASWNVHGGLASKLLKPSFQNLLDDYDIVLLQETHLCPEQEYQFVLPNGFDIFVESRLNSEWLGQTGGGVATLVRETLSATVHTSLRISW